jgi:hypothetical protein
MYIRRRVYDAAKGTCHTERPVAHGPEHCRLHFRELHETAISQKQSPYQ